MYWLPAIPILAYLILILSIYGHLRKSDPFLPGISATTYISVIIPCRNEQDHLPALLECLSEQDYPAELFEVIIVDDHSTDRTVETASVPYRTMKKELILNSGKGKKEAIRTGVMASAGDLIITTDADCTMGKTWLRIMAAFYEEKIPDMIIGPVRLKRRRGFFAKFQELEFLSLQGVTCGTAMEGKPIMCNGANLAFTRKTYLDHNRNLHPGVPSGDDIFLLHSLKKDNGAKIMWLESEDAIVSTHASPGIPAFIRQRKRWISKWTYYRDRFTIAVGMITFITVMVVSSMMAAVFFDPGYVLPLVAVLLLKSVPDYLLLRNRTKKYGEEDLLKWFAPVQLIYPFYVLGVVLFACIPKGSKVS